MEENNLLILLFLWPVINGIKKMNQKPKAIQVNYFLTHPAKHNKVRQLQKTCEKKWRGGWGAGFNWPLRERTFFLSAHGRKKESLPVTKAEPGVQVAATETFFSRSHNASCMTGGRKNDSP